MKNSILAFCVSISLFAWSLVPRAARTVQVDGEGVLRWTDDTSEVALVGVNYYTPFTVDYEALAKMKADIRAVMREDVAHFRRLGIGCVRIHCFERQFSTPDGAFVANDHVALLDDLIDLCAANGIYMVLTPIAWWGGAYAKSTDGFSDHYTMHEMTSNRTARAIQARFLKEFGEHVNAVTGRRYADDPAILAFECINEPLYPKGHPDADVTDYVNALVDGLRASGTTKPIYYNSWQKRNAACGASRADGITGSYYPTGLCANHALTDSQLGRIVASSIHPDEHIAKKSRMIYEFDAADTPGSYMYPALGKLFRAEGVQVASQFQYDPMRLADRNLNWKTHHLNLVYTPAKALSLAIMQEVFRHVPRGGAYTPSKTEIVFPPFRVDGVRDLSEFATPDKYYYTNDPVTPPPDPSALRHVWGCGRSSVAASTGSGIYFLDRAAEGVWRLQLYPSVFTVADPYTGRDVQKVVVLAEKPRVTLRLPGLGADWQARQKNLTVTAVDGTAELSPGDWVIVANGKSPDAGWHLDVPAYVAPPPEPPTTHVAVNVPSQWAAGQDLPLSLARVYADKITAKLVRAADGREAAFDVGDSPRIPANLLEPGVWGLTFHADGPHGTVSLPGAAADDADWTRTSAPAVSLLPEETIAVHTPASSDRKFCKGSHHPVKPFPALQGRHASLWLEIENRGKAEARLEIGFRLKDGKGFGVNVRTRPGMSTITLTPDLIIPLWGGPKTERRWEDVRSVSVLTGAWLWPDQSVPETDVVIRRLDRLEVEPGYTVTVCKAPGEWELFNVQAALRQHLWGIGEKWSCPVLDDRGRRAYHLHVGSFGGQMECASVRVNADGPAYAQLFPQTGPGKTLVVRARGARPQTDKLEVALCLDNGQVWGTVVTLTSTWREIRVPFAQLNYFRQWGGLPAISATERPDVRRLRSINLCFGKWLFPKTFNETHAFEISSIRVED